MPSFSDGLEAGFVGMVVCFVMAAVLSAIVTSVGMPWLSIIVLVASIIGVIELLENAPYWSIAYSAGFILSIILFGKYFLEWWELPITITILCFYFSLKIYNRFFT